RSRSVVELLLLLCPRCRAPHSFAPHYTGPRRRAARRASPAQPIAAHGLAATSIDTTIRARRVGSRPIAPGAVPRGDYRVRTSPTLAPRRYRPVRLHEGAIHEGRAPNLSPVSGNGRR